MDQNEISDTEIELIMDAEMDSFNEWSAIESLIEDDKYTTIILNFEPTTYINSSSFGNIVKFNQEASEKGKTLKLCKLSTQVEMVFKTLGGFEILNIE